MTFETPCKNCGHRLSSHRVEFGGDGSCERCPCKEFIEPDREKEQS